MTAQLEWDLCKHVRAKDVARVIALLEEGASPDAPTQHEVPLVLAADRGSLEMVRALLAKGADANRVRSTEGMSLVTQFDGMSALDHALNKSEELVVALVEGGADLTRPLRGILSGVLARDRIEAISSWERARAALESRGAPRSPDDALALVPAILAGRAKRVVALLESATQEERESALVMAAQVGATEMVQLLVAKGVSQAALQSAVFYPIQNGFIDSVRALLDAGVDLATETGHHSAPALMVAAFNGRTEIAKLLLARGANPNQRHRGETPLGEAKRHPETLAAIMAAGADPKAEQKLRAATRKKLEPYARPAWRPIVARGEGDARGSRLGGRAWLASDETWPTGTDGAKLAHVLTLDLAGVPEAFRGVIAELGSGLVRVFRSRSTYDTRVLVTTSTDGELVDDGSKSDARAIVGWAPLADDLPNGEVGIEPHHLIRIKGKAGLDERMVQNLNHTGHELGGWPHWVQEPSYPTKGAIDRLLFQVDEGDSVLGFLFQSAAEPTKLIFTEQKL